LRSLALALGLLFLIAPPAAGAAAPTPWLRIADGRLGDFEWSVKIRRPDGSSSGALGPCLLVGAKWQLSSFSFRRSRYRTCTNGDGRLTALDPPLIGSGVLTGDDKGITAVGIVVPPAVRRLRVTLSDGHTSAIPLQRLTPQQARRARLGRFRYAAFAVRGSWCAERVVTLNARGAPLWDSGTDEYPCSASNLQAPAGD
jgi:hypothetical protein